MKKTETQLTAETKKSKGFRVEEEEETLRVTVSGRRALTQRLSSSPGMHVTKLKTNQEAGLCRTTH